MAKLLKEEGFNQNSELLFSKFIGIKLLSLSTSEYHIIRNESVEIFRTTHDLISAPTTDELLEELPDFINGYFLTIVKCDKYFWVGYDNEFNDKKTLCAFENGLLPDALANIWLYLKKENLLPKGN